MSETVPGAYDPAPGNVRTGLPDIYGNPGGRLPDQFQVAKGGVECPNVGYERRLIQVVGYRRTLSQKEIMSRT